MKRRLGHLGKLSRLSPWERRLLVQAYIELFRVEVEVRRVGLAGLLARLETATRAPVMTYTGEGAQDAVAQSAWAAQTACNHWWRRTRCVERALTLYRLLETRGIGASLRIGTRKNGSELNSHLWVEVGERAFGKDAFQPMTGFLSLVNGFGSSET